MSNKELEPPCGNPYTILGLQYGATDADISKAYKKYALLYHPDKQQKKPTLLSTKEKETIAKKFHDLTEAKSFLLDSEFIEKRKKYDLYLKSKLHRMKEDEERDRFMDRKRKELRDELLQKEKMAKTSKSALKPSKKDIISNLQKEGKRMREEYTQEQQQKEINNILNKQSLKEKLQQRQVKLKWRSSCNEIDPLDQKESITNLLKQFGTISSIDVKRDKNIAIITFEDVQSCNDCVEYFLHHDGIRASFVGKNKYSQPKQHFLNKEESLEERSRRQAAEREAIIRQMEEDGDDAVGTKQSYKSSASDGIGIVSFPPKMPMDIGCTNPLEQLERYEMLYIPKEYRIC